MSQQHAEFEGEFRDGPRPHEAYHENQMETPISSYMTSVPPQMSYGQPLHIYVNVPGQAPQTPTPQHQPLQQPRLQPVQQPRQDTTGLGVRVVLGIFSMLFVMIMFLVALSMVQDSWYNSAAGPMGLMAILFALAFASLVLIINVVVNRKR